MQFMTTLLFSSKLFIALFPLLLSTTQRHHDPFSLRRNPSFSFRCSHCYSPPQVFNDLTALPPLLFPLLAPSGICLPQLFFLTDPFFLSMLLAKTAVSARDVAAAPFACRRYFGRLTFRANFLALLMDPLNGCTAGPFG